VIATSNVYVLNRVVNVETSTSAPLTLINHVDVPNMSVIYTGLPPRNAAICCAVYNFGGVAGITIGSGGVNGSGVIDSVVQFVM
jgi:hypothetical protein